MLEAHGGRDTLRSIETIVFSGKITTRSDIGTVALILARPGKLRATMKYQNRYEDRILLDNRGWRNFGDGFVEAFDHSLDAMVFQYNHLNLPMGVLEGNYKISYIEEKITDTIYPALKLTDISSPPMMVILDPDTGLIKQVNGRITAGSQEVIMGVGYEDYREVAGVMLPYRIINYVNGNVIAESFYDRVAVNAELERDVFTVNNRGILQ